MQLQVLEVNDLLIHEDIEGFIELGAPTDEYESEAAQITAAILQIAPDARTGDAILSVAAIIWMNSFELSNEDMQLRMPALQRVCETIFKKL